MRGAPKPLLAFAVAALLASGLAACGGGDSSTSGDSGQASTQAQTTTAPGGGKSEKGSHGDSSQGSGKNAAGKSAESNGAVPGDTSDSFTPEQHSDSGGGAKQFEQKGGDNSIQESGSEATGSEFTQAAAALHGYLDARAAGAWEAACSYMAAGVVESLGQLAAGSGQVQSCAQLLAGLSAGVPPAALRESAQADVGSLRADGDSGFLLFHGAHDTAYFMPMAREGGEWKVAAIAPSALL